MQINLDSLLSRYASLKEIALSDSRHDEILKLFEYIDQNTDFLSAPASTKYHLSCHHGLLMHTVSVAETMIRMKKLLASDISNSSCVLVALLHDVGKHNQYIEKEPTEKQKQYGYKATPPYLMREDIVYMEHEIRSLYIIMASNSGLQLSEDEWQAIAYHNEPYTEQHSAFKDCKLKVLLSMADYWSTRFLED